MPEIHSGASGNTLTPFGIATALPPAPKNVCRSMHNPNYFFPLAYGFGGGTLAKVLRALRNTFCFVTSLLKYLTAGDNPAEIFFPVKSVDKNVAAQYGLINRT